MWTLLASLLIGNTLLLVINLPLAPLWARLLQIPRPQLYAGIIFFTAAMYQVLRAITGSRAWAAISPGDMMDVVADAVFRIRSTPPVPVLVAALVIAVLIAASIWILERKVRPVEIVA